MWEPSCRDNYVGETGRRIIKKIKDHSGRDHASHTVKHNIETSHTDVNNATSKSLIWISVTTKVNRKLRSLYGQRPETYTKCTGEINTSEAL